MSDTPRTPESDHEHPEYEGFVEPWRHAHEVTHRHPALGSAGNTPAPPLGPDERAELAALRLVGDALFSSLEAEGAETAVRGNTPAQEPLRGIALAVECDVIEFQAGMLARAIREDHPQVDLLARELLERVAALSGVRVAPRPPETEE